MNQQKDCFDFYQCFSEILFSISESLRPPGQKELIGFSAFSDLSISQGKRMHLLILCFLHPAIQLRSFDVNN